MPQAETYIDGINMKNRATAPKNSGSVKLTLLLLLAIIAAVGFTYKNKKHSICDRHVKVVAIKLGPKTIIRPALAENKPGGSEEFSSMVARLHPYAAINGTYYDKKMMPLGDVVIDGKVVSHGCQHHAIAITKDGRVDFIHRVNRSFNWSGYKYGLACGPRLIHNGKIALDPVADGFNPVSLRKCAWRSGVGKTADGKLLLVTANKSIKLSEFADIMLSLGAVEAMNLDGGGASGLYHEGSTITTPTLPMSNLLMVYEK